MAQFRLSPAADRDIASILAWTHEHFGEQARQRYEALLVQAMIDLAEDAERPGCASREEISGVARTYHLWHSRNHGGTTRQSLNKTEAQKKRPPGR
jgi:toxin ParE1/3/4